MIRFAEINRAKSENYNPRYQRHHLVPLQVTSIAPLSDLIDSLNRSGSSLHDFDRNGILLPCHEAEAILSGRPLHRGPHPRYNEMVIERMLVIAELADQFDSECARVSFVNFRISSLQSGLKRGLKTGGFSKLRLHRQDPFRSRQKFDDLDRYVDLLWSTTGKLSGASF